MPSYSAEIYIEVDEFFEDMDTDDKNRMMELISKDSDIIARATRNEKFIKDFAYHLKYTDSEHLQLLKDELLKP